MVSLSTIKLNKVELSGTCSVDVFWAPPARPFQPTAVLPLPFCVRPPRIVRLACQSQWCHCRRGKGTQHGSAGRATLFGTAKAPTGRSPQPAPSVPGKKTAALHGPRGRRARSSWSRKEDSDENLPCWMWKCGAEGFFPISTEKGSLLLS